ncbi:MAG TPA: TerC family protein [Pirellulales bacterium]|nr:TerC family protein [Pirellulales bacterium]
MLRPRARHFALTHVTNLVQPNLINVPLWYWFAFGGFVIAMLALDLGVFHRRSRETGWRGAAISTLIWCSLAVAFDGVVWYIYSHHNGPAAGRQAALEFLTGYLIEWSLSMDNVFVFAVIFSYFKVAKKYQYRVLFWGILGAIVMRLLFVLIGAALIHQFKWILYVLGVFLIYSGIQLIRHDDQVDPEQGFVLRLARRWLPVSRDEHGERFMVVENGRRVITTLFLVLLVVESTDVAFAIDSVPAIFGITEEPFIVYTSNIFAILGLRALYFLLAGFMDLFHYLKYGLSAILIFVGIKMLLPSVGVHISAWISLLVVLGLLAIAILASIIPHKGRAPQSDADDKPADD